MVDSRIDSNLLLPQLRSWVVRLEWASDQQVQVWILVPQLSPRSNQVDNPFSGDEPADEPNHKSIVVQAEVGPYPRPGRQVKALRIEALRCIDPISTASSKRHDFRWLT